MNKQELAKQLLKIATELTATNAEFLDLMLTDGGYNEVMRIVKYFGIHGGVYEGEGGDVNFVLFNTSGGASPAKVKVMEALFPDDEPEHVEEQSKRVSFF